MIAKSELS